MMICSGAGASGASLNLAVGIGLVVSRTLGTEAGMGMSRVGTSKGGKSIAGGGPADTSMTTASGTSSTVGAWFSIGAGLSMAVVGAPDRGAATATEVGETRREAPVLDRVNLASRSARI